MEIGYFVGLVIIGWIAVQGLWEVLNGEMGLPIPELGQ